MEGYQLDEIDNQIVISHPQFEKLVPLINLGDSYLPEKIKERILEQPLLYKQTVNYYKKYSYNIKPQYQLYKKKQLTGLQYTYMHWQSILGLLPNHKGGRVPTRLTKEQRMEVYKLESLSQEMILLCKNNITTLDELNTHELFLQKELATSIAKRKRCYSKVRRSKTEEEKNSWKEMAKAHTPNISKLRKQIKFCHNIAERSIRLAEQSQIVEKQHYKIR